MNAININFLTPIWWWIAPVSSIIVLTFAYTFYKKMMLADPGNEKMQLIANYIREGAMAYLKQQYKTVFMVFIKSCQKTTKLAWWMNGILCDRGF